MPKDVIILDKLSKTFSTGWPWKKAPALMPLDLAVREGEIIGYLGPNGAGKTTTLKLMVGLLRPTSGRALIHGRSPREARARRGIGFLPENPYFYEYLSGMEFLMLCARLGGGKSSPAEIGALLDQVGVSEAAGRPLRKYSKGMLQRIGLAQALVNDPDILILDEPMSGLDPIGRREVRDLILRLKADGKTIFFSSHILADVELICDRVAFLNRGRLLRVQSVGDVLGRERGRVEVKVGGLSEAEAERLAARAGSVIRGPEAVVFIVESPDDAPPLIESSVRAGGKLISVNPRRRTLEELFLTLIREDPS